MNLHLQKLQETIEPYRQQIIGHSMYAQINNLKNLQVFMQHHVFAVWDFMSLLKSLQIQLTCTTLPWQVKGSGNTRFLINEIVAGEESDTDLHGARKSHYEMYLDAMEQAGADTSTIRNFLQEVTETESIEAAFAQVDHPPQAKQFVTHTFNVIQNMPVGVQAAVFTFGREDLIPNMFLSIVRDIEKHFPDNVQLFTYYLERHIEVDGGHHGQLALEMTQELCGDDAELWQQATNACVASLQKRIDLWNAVQAALPA